MVWKRAVVRKVAEGVWKGVRAGVGVRRVCEVRVRVMVRSSGYGQRVLYKIASFGCEMVEGKR